MKIFRSVLVALVAVGIMPTAHAALIVTLSELGNNNVLATFQGSGTVSGSAGVTVRANLGDAFLVNGQNAPLSAPLLFGNTSITRMGFDDDGSNGGDDWSIHFADLLPSGTTYSIDAATMLVGVSFTDLIPGVFDGGIDGGANLGGLSLVIQNAPPPPLPGPVPAPAGLFLLGIGLAGLVVRRAVTRTRRSL